MDRVILKHYGAGFFLDAAVTLAYVSVPFVVFDRLGGDERMSGTVGACLSLTYAAACIGSSLLVSRVSHGIRLAAVGAFVCGGGFYASTFASDPVVFTLTCMVAFCGLAAAWPAMHAWLGAVPDSARRSKYIAHFNISWIVGMSAGSLASGALYDVGPALPFAAAFGCAAMVCLLLFTQPHERDHFRRDPGAITLSETVPERVTSRGFLYCMWFTCLVGWSIRGASLHVFPKRIDDLMDAGSLSLLGLEGSAPFPFPAATTFSMLAFTQTFASALVFYIMGSTSRWHFRYGWVLAIQVVGAVALYAMGVSHSMVVLLACYAGIGACNYAVFFACLFYAVSDPERKHARAAINEGIVGGGNFTGALLFGWIAGLTTISAAFTGAVWVIGALIVAEWFVLKAVARGDADAPGAVIQKTA